MDRDMIGWMSFAVGLTIFMACLQMVNPVQAETGSPDKQMSKSELVDKIFQIIPWKKEAKATSAVAFKTQIRKMRETGVMSNDTLKEVRDAMDQYMQKMVSDPEMKKKMKSLYCKVYTKKELKALLEFYQSPAGERIAKKQVVLSKRAAELGIDLAFKHRAWFQNRMAKIMMSE